jgi:hypothetical protein
MPSAPFETVILTAALYGILLIFIGMFTIVYQWVLVDATRVRLGEMANQVAHEITCIYSMCQQSRNEQIQLFKPIEIPVSTSGYGYAIELKKIGETWFVTTYLEANRAVNASSPLWEDQSEAVKVETGSGDLSVNSYLIRYQAILHSGQARPVVWAEKKPDGTIRVGVGWVSGGG